jgi:non-ribosomal peptide synthetase component E (peptide arylation enzyme)
MRRRLTKPGVNLGPVRSTTVRSEDHRKATYRELHALTRDPAAKLRGLGISRTDTVASSPA